MFSAFVNSTCLSDVEFQVLKDAKGVIPAHKLLLAAKSPVFYAIFCGKLADTKERIDLSDCEFEGMLEFLRYVYTDKVRLNGDNVMQVFYLAEKYIIPNLTKECFYFLRENLDTFNVFVFLNTRYFFLTNTAGILSTRTPKRF